MGIAHALLVLITVLAACGPRATTTTPRPPTGASAPGDDLARAQAGVSPGDDTGSLADPRLGGDAGAATVIDLDTIRIGVIGHDASGAPELEATAAGDLLSAAAAAVAADKGSEALVLYRRLATHFPESRYAPVALVNISLIYEGRHEYDAAISALLERVRLYPEGHEAIEAHLRAAALDAQREHWAASAATLADVLARPNLTHTDRIEGLARLGYAQLEQRQLDLARTTLTDAITVWRRAPRIQDPYFVAMSHYYLGEVLHREFEDAPVRLAPEGGDEQLRRDLDAKEAIGVHAYELWKDTLDFKQAYWATAAGHQMSQVFYELWQATVRAPYPRTMDERARPQYVTEVHARVRDRLEKALEGHRMNVELAKAYGVETFWSKSSEARAVEILAILSGEAQGQLVAPAP